MKKTRFLTLIAFILITNSLIAQDGGKPVAGAPATEKKGWPPEERLAFVSECIKEAQKGMSKDSARFYCHCMLERVEKRYPTIEEASNVTEADMRSEAWQKDVEACLVGNWTSKNRAEFMADCVKSAKTGVGEEKATTYCECMMYKMERYFPNYADAGKLAEEKLRSPEWQKIIASCLNF